MDPHGTCGYLALQDFLKEGETGIFLETAHPAKFKEKVDEILLTDIPIPVRLKNFMQGKKQRVSMEHDFNDFKGFLLHRQ